MHYVMVSSFGNFWDGVDNREACYWKSMIHPYPLDFRNGTPTTFIKLDKRSLMPQKSWEGYVDGFRNVRRGIRPSVAFRVHLQVEVPIPEKYRALSVGWYCESDTVSSAPNWRDYAPSSAPNSNVTVARWDPPFFGTLMTTTDRNEFEELTFKLLRLLGIHEAFRYDEQTGYSGVFFQFGHADGFFQFGHLSVLYDCTPQNSSDDHNGTLLENFAYQLRSGTIKYGPYKYDVSPSYKQVWLITRGLSRTIERSIDVVIKEVPIAKLIDVYTRRLQTNWDEKQLETELKDI